MFLVFFFVGPGIVMLSCIGVVLNWQIWQLLGKCYGRRSAD